MRYRDLAETLRSRIARGHHGPGGALPSEAELAHSYETSRVTVRRALELLRGEGLVTSRKGSGWFVAVDPVHQTLGRFLTVEAALQAAGIESRRRVVFFRFEPADDDIAQALELPRDDEVLCVRRVNLAGDEPFAIVTVWVPGEIGGQFSRAQAERSTFYELVSGLGIELGRVTQSITATAADAAEARLLSVRSGTPLLVCRRVTCETAGRPVLASEHLYAGHRTVLDVEFPSARPARIDAPPGVRLVASQSEGFVRREPVA